jgi:DNA-binding HxlR family transcriptional regulator
MTEYHQYCPVARASEILADRWTPLIVREMLAGSRHFNEIRRGLPGISRSLLVSRLRHLEDNGVVERKPSVQSNFAEYVLTEAGTSLREVFDRIGAWGSRWAFGEPAEDELNPELLMWKIHQRIDRSKLPPRRIVVQFDLAGRKRRRFWLVLEQREVSVCLKPPGFDADLVLATDVSLLYQVWLGRVDYDTAVARRGIMLDGPRDLARALPGWFMWSPMARYVRESSKAEIMNR